MNDLRAQKTDDFTDYNIKFIALSEELVELGQSIDVKMRPYVGTHLPYFSVLSIEQKRNVILNLENYLDICHSTLAQGNSLKNARSLTWNALIKYGLTPCSDLFNHIKDTDLVEIYDKEHVQIFRNFVFFELCSYTIEDIFTRPWPELFLRPDQGTTEKLIEVIGSAWTNNTKHTIPIDIGPHVVLEPHSSFNHVLIDDIKFISPVYDKSHRPTGFVCIEEAYLKAAPSATEQERILLKNHSADMH